MKKNFKIIVPLILTFIISISTTAWLIFSYFNALSARDAQAQITIINTTKQVSHQISNHLQRIMKELETPVNMIASLLENNAADSPLIKQELLKKPTAIKGLGVISMHTGSKFPNSTGLYYVEKNGEQQLIPLLDNDEHEPALNYFLTLSNDRSGIIIDPQTGTEVFVYSKKITHNDQDIFTFATQSRDSIQNILNTLCLKNNGSWFIANDDGTIIMRPHTISTTNSPTLDSLTQIRSTLTKLIMHQRGYLAYTNKATHQPSWLVCEPIHHASLMLCGIFEKTTVSVLHDNNFYRLILIILNIFTSFFFLLIILILVFNPVHMYRWLLFLGIACMCFLTIQVLWQKATTRPIFSSEALKGKLI